jgi:hypothetical protein
VYISCSSEHGAQLGLCIMFKMFEDRSGQKPKSHSTIRKIVMRFFRTTLINQNCILETIKSRLNSGNACYLSLQNIFSSRFPPKNKKLQVYRAIIFTFCLYVCETWSLTFREERRLRLSEHRVLRRIFGPKKVEFTGEWRKPDYEELTDLYSIPNSIRTG